METVLVLILVIMLAIVLNRLNRVYDIISNLRGDLHDVQSRLSELKKAQSGSDQMLSDISERIAAGLAGPGAAEAPPQTVVEIETADAADIAVSLPREEEELIENAIEEALNRQPAGEEEIVLQELGIPESGVPEQTVAAAFIEAPEKKSWYARFKEKNPDLEKFIGENIINKIGIVILVLGVSFFVKYAIDKEWISEPLRVGIGILVGSAVLFIANRLRINYKAFSSVLVAGAFSIFYFTIAIAFHDYHLFSQTTAFIIMVLITAFSVAISVGYDREELAIMSLIGGFAVPFMVSTGSGNPVVLFSYIAILNVGVLVFSYLRKWNITIFLAFVFTALLLCGWFFLEGYEKKLFTVTLIFATIFYFKFNAISIANNIRDRGKVTYLQYAVILLNTGCYYTLGYMVVNNLNPGLLGLFTLSLALYNVLFAYILYKKEIVDRNAIYLLVGLALSFATLTIPLQFSKHYITLFWAVEAVLLFWLAGRSGIHRFKIVAVVVQVLMLISLCMDWQRGYLVSDESLPVVLNAVFVTGVVALASLWATARLLENERVPVHIWKIKFNPVAYRSGVLAALLLTGYLTGMFEVVYQGYRLISNTATAASLGLLYHFVFFFVLAKAGSVNPALEKLQRIVGVSAVLLFIVVTSYIPYNEIFYNINNGTSYSLAFYTHLINLCLVSVLLFDLFRKLVPGNAGEAPSFNRAIWLFAIAVVYILSNELMLVAHYINRDIVSFASLEAEYPAEHPELNWNRMNLIRQSFSEVRNQVVKIGFPILWGSISFLFLILGIRISQRLIRIAALVLLAITVIKLFLYDIRNVSETGKIIAFILLGVVILVISFVYQKIRKLIADDSTTHAAPNDQNN